MSLLVTGFATDPGNIDDYMAVVVVVVEMLLQCKAPTIVNIYATYACFSVVVVSLVGDNWCTDDRTDGGRMGFTLGFRGGEEGQSEVTE